MHLINNDQLQWKRFVGDDKFDYPIDYSTAVLDVNENGHINLLTKWEPNSYCHFHRHTATSTTSTVLQGELHVEDIEIESGKVINSKTRNVGDYASKDGGDVHMEKGGPEGAIVLFSLYTKDGSLAESLDKQGNVISESNINQFLK